MPAEPRYIGDGVYVQLDGFEVVVLTTGTHEINKADQVIYLEPDVIKQFRNWLEEGGI